MIEVLNGGIYKIARACDLPKLIRLLDSEVWEICVAWINLRIVDDLETDVRGEITYALPKALRSSSDTFYINEKYCGKAQQNLFILKRVPNSKSNVWLDLCELRSDFARGDRSRRRSLPPLFLWLHRGANEQHPGNTESNIKA